MTGLSHLRDELVERSTSLLGEASHLAERGAHTAARLAEDQASSLRSSLPDSVPRLSVSRRRRAPSMTSRSSKLGVVVALVATGVAVYLWRAKRHAAATAEYLDVHEASHRGQEFRVAS